MPIPIYQIPILATRIIVECMEKVDLVMFSLCSKRVYWVVKLCGMKDVSYLDLTWEDTCGFKEIERRDLFLLEVERSDSQVIKSKEANLEINITDELILVVDTGDDARYAINVESNINYDLGARKYMTMNGSRVPFVTNPGEEMCTLWDDKTEGLLNLLDYFYEKFKCTLKLDFYYSGKDPEVLSHFRRVIHHIMQRDLTVSYAVVSSREQLIPDEDFSFILENLKVNGNFRILAEPSRTFQFNGRIQSPSIEIGHSQWFPLSHLLNSDYEQVEFTESQFTKNDLNLFLQQWMSGEFPKLVKLKFGMVKGSEEVIFPKGWTKSSRGMHKVYEYEGVIGNRRVSAKLSSYIWWTDFKMEVEYGELVEQEDGEDDGEVGSDDE